MTLHDPNLRDIAIDSAAASALLVLRCMLMHALLSAFTDADEIGERHNLSPVLLLSMHFG